MSDGGKGDTRRPGKGYCDGYDKIDWGRKRNPKEEYVAIVHEYYVGPLDLDRVIRKERVDRDKTKF